MQLQVPMIKQKNFQKNSFLLIETILALIIVSIILSAFFKLLINNNDNTYEDLIKNQNEVILNQTISNFQNYKFINNDK